tara:strand:- start:1337 stop:1783 length:447 start_codon:yes stop_codon:yes gene_type:complete
MARLGTDGLTDPTVVPPNDPSLTRPRARPKDAARVGNGTVDKSVRPRARPEDKSIFGMKPTLKRDSSNTENKRGFTPGEQAPSQSEQNKRGFTPKTDKKPKSKKKDPGGGDFRPPEILGRPSKPKIDIIKFKNGGCVMKKTNQKVFMG